MTCHYFNTHYRLTYKLLLFFLFIGIGCNVLANSIETIRLVDESDITQVVNHKPVFRWQFETSPDQYSLRLALFQVNQQEDSLVYEKDIPSFQQNKYQLITPHLLTDGKEYRLTIQAEIAQETLEKSITFRMNSRPEPVEILTPQNQIFTTDTLLLSITRSRDAVIDPQNLQYQVRINDKPTNTIIDTLISSFHDSLLIFGNQLAENGRFTAYIRSYDGREYSGWSNSLTFFMNRVNEPPERFTLVTTPGKIFKQAPLLEWEKTQDPEAAFGGSVRGYRVVISPYEDFSLPTEIDTVDKAIRQYSPKKIDNHRKYYWTITAFDNDSLERNSDSPGHFYLNRGNEPPQEAQLIQPLKEAILQPEDRIIWQQTPDPDRWDRLSYTITLYHQDKEVGNFFLSQSKIDSARKGFLPNISVTYDNRVMITLKTLDLTNQLAEGNTYHLAIETADNWQGKKISRKATYSFQFDDNINQPPNPPIRGFSPDSVIIQNSHPVLTWQPGKDDDVKDELKYRVLISQHPDFISTGIIEVESNYNESYVQLKTELMENQQYFWKVKSIDLMDSSSEWSRISSFWVNRINEPPKGPVTLLAPKNYTEFDTESTFWWTKTTDPDPGDRVRYLLEIGTKKNFRRPTYSYLIPAIDPKLVWNEDDSEAPEQTAGVFVNEHSEVFKLIDNRMYYWRVTALDNQNLKSEKQFKYPRIVFNQTNDPPDIPGGFFPGNGAIVNSATPRIQWQHSVDPDFADLTSTLFYKLQLSQYFDFPQESTTQYQSKVGDNFVTIPDPLAENEKYYYRLNAFDSHGDSSGWSMVDSFYVNATLEPPTVPVNMIPRDNIQLSHYSPQISWGISRDNDPDYDPNRLTYKIKYLQEKWLGHKKEKKKTTYQTTAPGDNSIKISNLSENTYYVYQVQAIDHTGKKSKWSKLIHFSVNKYNEPPGHFKLLQPGNHADSVVTDITFIWQPSYDPDPGDKITYNFYLSEDSTFSSQVSQVALFGTAADSMFHKPSINLKRATKYFWKVSAEDKEGVMVWGANSDTAPFVFTTVGYKKNRAGRNTKFLLYDNTPNPFYTITRIKYEVKEYSHVRVEIYNVLGEKVKTLASRNHSAGSYTVEWNGTDELGSQVPGGMYICRMIARGFVQNKKMLLLR